MTTIKGYVEPKRIHTKSNGTVLYVIQAVLLNYIYIQGTDFHKRILPS